MPSQFIYEDAPFPSCHASTIVETKPGNFLAAWFGGTREGADDVEIWLSRLPAGSAQWSAPEKVASGKGVPCWNPVLYYDRGRDEVTLFFKEGPSPREWSGFYRRSNDGGKTFGDRYILPAGLLGPVKNKAIDLKGGVILAPTSVESYQAWACWMERSTDGGRTWTRQGPIHHPQEPQGVIQPAVLKLTDGRLMALMRSRNLGQVCQAISTDQGLTWGPAEVIESLPNPNSGIDAVTLADGRHVIVYNPTHKGRSPLSMAISADDGGSWQNLRILEDQPGEYSYPAVIQASDGTVHTTYTWQRKTIRHQWFALDELSA